MGHGDYDVICKGCGYTNGHHNECTVENLPSRELVKRMAARIYELEAELKLVGDSESTGIAFDALRQINDGQARRIAELQEQCDTLAHETLRLEQQLEVKLFSRRRMEQQLARYKAGIEVEGKQYFGRVIYLNQKTDLSMGETSVRVIVLKGGDQ